ncbi:MAG: branched-chain amino acid transport system ATP-binding protein livM, partial [Actinomycetota bacterium]|nr:branched-chain amino acid transport system ATP-binding protein livM [Actinomycetota bacterium]
AGAIWASMALSLNILVGYAGQISLGHGALVAVGAYSTGVIAGRWYLPGGVGFVVAVAVGGAFAFLVGLPALRLKGLYLAVTTIAFQALTENFLLKIPWLSRGSAGLSVPRPYAWGANWNRNIDFLGLALLVTLGIWLLDTNVTRTKLGRAFFAIREDEQVAQSRGVDVTRYKLLAFTLSGALAGAAGSMYAHRFGFINSDSFTLEKTSLLLLVMVVVGGLGSRTGVAVAAAVFAVMPLLLKSLVGWDYILGALLLVYAMAHNPGGVAAAIREAREKREAKQKTEDHEAGMHDLPSLPRPDNLASTVAVPGTTLLEVVDLTVRFGGLTAVDDASITVPAGQIVGLIGPNGAGKSTLFNAAGGFVTPNAGRVRFNGRDITELAPHQRAALGIGRTFQHTGLARNLSVLENLLLAQHSAATYGWGEALLYVGKAGPCEEELHRRSIEVIEALGFAEKTDVPVRNLSGGQQRIVELACALVTAPQLLMLDEPSAGMAPAAVENLAQRLRELRDDLGRTVLLIEHHIPLVLDVCDHVYVLDAGRIIASGAPAEIAALPEVMTAYLGEEVAVLA